MSASKRSNTSTSASMSKKKRSTDKGHVGASWAQFLLSELDADIAKDSGRCHPAKAVLDAVRVHGEAFYQRTQDFIDAKRSHTAPETKPTALPYPTRDPVRVPTACLLSEAQGTGNEKEKEKTSERQEEGGGRRRRLNKRTAERNTMTNSRQAGKV
jgi:hypothetical protein